MSYSLLSREVWPGRDVLSRHFFPSQVASYRFFANGFMSPNPSAWCNPKSCLIGPDVCMSTNVSVFSFPSNTSCGLDQQNILTWNILPGHLQKSQNPRLRLNRIQKCTVFKKLLYSLLQCTLLNQKCGQIYQRFVWTTNLQLTEQYPTWVLSVSEKYLTLSCHEV